VPGVLKMRCRGTIKILADTDRYEKPWSCLSVSSLWLVCLGPVQIRMCLQGEYLSADGRKVNECVLHGGKTKSGRAA